MTKVSRIPVKLEKMNLFLDDFWAAVASLESKVEAKNFFDQFLTHTERKMFAKRFQVAMMLLLKYDYATIKQRIRVTDSTIAKISNWIQENRKELINVAQRIIRLKEEKLEILESGKKRLRGKAAGLSSFDSLGGEIIGSIKNSNKRRSLSR